MKIISLIILVIVNSLVEIRCESNGPIVDTKLGQIRGTVRTLEDGKSIVHLFDGIRYGEPPVGVMRFRHPVPVSKWNGTYDATEIKKSCPQIISLVPDDAPISEDCLFLSVWQPSKAMTDGHSRSVMVFIHGGSFDSGSEFTIAYDARWMAAIGDVIVVTINYRLGALGFLYGGTDDVPGNAGLYDQIMAIQWVKDNIDSFGGDPNTITIFGESAGSMSVGALVVSPLTKGLFKRAIMESGSPDSLIGSDSKQTQLIKFNSFVEKLKCQSSDNKQVVDCLRKAHVSDILKLGKNALINFEVMNPTYGDQLLPKRPYEALTRGEYDQDLELLFGSNQDEGSLFLINVFTGLAPDNHPNLTVQMAKQYIFLVMTVLKQNNINEIAEFYTKGLKDNQNTELLRSVSNSLGDYVLTCPTVLFGAAFARAHKSNKAYAYRLTHKPSISAFTSCKEWMGVCHADELVFLYGFPIALRGVSFTEADYKLSRDMIRVWTTFAKTGTPPAIDGVQWPQAIDDKSANSSVKYMELNPFGYKVVENGYKENCDGLWKAILETK